MHLSALRRTLGRRTRRLGKRVLFFGLAHSCPVCGGRVRRFMPHGIVPRPHARCPICGALERHRLLWLFFARRTNLFEPASKRMLHLAPEHAFMTKLRRTPGLEYHPVDLSSPEARVKLDVTAIPYEEMSFDVIYCSHVLEHVLDDRLAMRELRRVLRPTGWAVIQVPITAPATIEDPTVTDPRERERLFGQWDHVRRYGPDYIQRLEAAGFAVEVVPVAALASPAQRRRYGLLADETVVYCTRGRDQA